MHIADACIRVKELHEGAETQHGRCAGGGMFGSDFGGGVPVDEDETPFFGGGGGG